MRIGQITNAKERDSQTWSSGFRLVFSQSRSSFVALLLMLALLVSSSNVEAQKRKKSKTPKPAPQSGLAERAAKAKDDVIAAAKAYKDSLEKLLVYQENDVKVANELVEK